MWNGNFFPYVRQSKKKTVWWCVSYGSLNTRDNKLPCAGADMHRERERAREEKSVSLKNMKQEGCIRANENVILCVRTHTATAQWWNDKSTRWTFLAYWKGYMHQFSRRNVHKLLLILHYNIIIMCINCNKSLFLYLSFCPCRLLSHSLGVSLCCLSIHNYIINFVWKIQLIFHWLYILHIASHHSFVSQTPLNSVTLCVLQQHDSNNSLKIHSFDGIDVSSLSITNETNIWMKANKWWFSFSLNRCYSTVCILHQHTHISHTHFPRCNVEVDVFVFANASLILLGISKLISIKMFC